MSNKELLQKMLNNEIEKDESFYRNLIDLMEKDDTYKSYKGMHFENDREMVKFYFPNEDVMFLDLIHGIHYAEFAYATMFLHGIIVDYDLDRALYWFKRAYHNNSQDAFAMIRELMEEHDKIDELKEFCVACVRMYNDPEIIAYCRENNIDYSNMTPAQEKLVNEYMEFYKRCKNYASEDDMLLIDKMMNTDNEDEFVSLIKQLEPLADDRLAHLYFHAEPYIYEDEIDTICDEKDKTKRQLMIREYLYDRERPYTEEELKQVEDLFSKYEDDLYLSDYERKFVYYHTNDSSFLKTMEYDSPAHSSYKRHKTYYEQSANESILYRMLDEDHRLSYGAGVKIINNIIEHNNKELEYRENNPTPRPKVLFFYHGSYDKRRHIFNELQYGYDERTIKEGMYDYMKFSIIYNCVKNCAVPGNVGSTMLYEYLYQKAAEKLEQEEPKTSS